MTPEELQQIKQDWHAGFYRNADVISQLIAEVEYQMAANEQADRVIAGLTAELQSARAEDARIQAKLEAELDQLRAGLDELLAKLREDESAEVVRVTGPGSTRRGTGRSEWPGE